MPSHPHKFRSKPTRSFSAAVHAMRTVYPTNPEWMGIDTLTRREVEQLLLLSVEYGRVPWAEYLWPHIRRRRIQVAALRHAVYHRGLSMVECILRLRRHRGDSAALYWCAKYGELGRESGIPSLLLPVTNIQKACRLAVKEAPACPYRKKWQEQALSFLSPHVPTDVQLSLARRAQSIGLEVGVLAALLTKNTLRDVLDNTEALTVRKQARL